MMTWSVERKTLLIWRVFQFWTFLMILILELVQSLGYRTIYSKIPFYLLTIWVIKLASLSLTGYLLVKFNSRWKDNLHKVDVYIDGLLSVIWFYQCITNLITFSDKEMGCNTITDDNQTKCRLFLGNTALSFFALSIALIMLMLSILRWKNGRDVTPTTHGVKSQAYLVRKGSLSNGEPALFFYSKNMHKPYNTQKYTSNSIGVNPTSPVNISIPEPEMVANSKCSRSVYVGMDNYEGEKDDPALKY